MTDKRKNKDNFPNLRFPGFSEEWEVKKLGEVSEINPKNSNLPSSFIYVDLESVNNGILIKETNIFKSEAPSRAQRLLEKKDVLFQMVRPYQKNNFYFNLDGNYVASTGYAQIRTKHNSQFIFQHLHNQKFVDKVIERCTGTSYPAINSSDLSKITISFPSKAEQEKIASLLLLIDESILLSMKIIDQLESQMHNLEDLLLMQKLRFKNKNGENFKDWTQKKMSDIGKTFNGLTGKSKDDFGSGKKYIQYKQIFDSSKINIQNCGFVNVSENEKQNQVQLGDVFFTVSSETPNEIGMSSVLLENVNNVFLNSFCFGFRTYSFEELIPEFSQFLFRSTIFRNEIVKLAQGSTRYNMSKTELLKLKVYLPSKEEQVKIANFLSTMYNKIEIEKKILEKIETQKKYLLSNLFT